MKVRDLIVLLQEEDQDAEVVLAKDAEGNYYSPVTDVDDGTYAEITTWNGEFYSRPAPDSGDDLKEEWTEEGYDDYQKAVCLWPIN